jgi:hypothetical protein
MSQHSTRSSRVIYYYEEWLLSVQKRSMLVLQHGTELCTVEENMTANMSILENITFLTFMCLSLKFQEVHTRTLYTNKCSRTFYSKEALGALFQKV